MRPNRVPSWRVLFGQLVKDWILFVLLRSVLVIHALKKINIKLKTALSRKIIQLGLTKSGSCLAVNSCGTWDLELIALCLIFPSEKTEYYAPFFQGLS